MKAVTVTKHDNGQIRVVSSSVTDEEATAMLRAGIERIEHR